MVKLRRPRFCEWRYILGTILKDVYRSSHCGINGIRGVSEALGRRFDPHIAFDPQHSELKDLALLQQLQCRSQLWLGSDPWPQELHMLWGSQKRK